MESNVNFQSSSSRVALITITKSADKRLLTSMRVFVSLQVALSNEVVVTDLASEGPLAGVGPHMRFEVSSLSELFETTLVGTKQDFCFVLWPRNFFNVLYKIKHLAPYKSLLVGRKSRLIHALSR
jgi:hypothetical protein